MRDWGVGRWLIVLPFGDDFKGKPAESGEADGPEKHGRHQVTPIYRSPTPLVTRLQVTNC